MLDLKIGQRYQVPSVVAYKYEEALGSFSFVVEICALDLRHYAPYLPPIANMDARLVEWPGEYGNRLWYAAYSIATGHDKFSTEDYNYSPDLISGNNIWYVPHLFRWQHWFTYLLWHDVVQRV